MRQVTDRDEMERLYGREEAERLQTIHEKYGRAKGELPVSPL